MSEPARPSQSEAEMIVVGAGFAGLYMLHQALELGLDVRVLEAAGGVGGTWYWNRYPGARCDIESMEYSFGFDEALQQEWEWTERYAAQPEILRYAEHVADRFELKTHISFDTRVTAATWDDDRGRWLVSTDQGEVVDTRFMVMATGCLSSANTPIIEGQDHFAGPSYHTGRWPHAGVDFTGQRVGVIGTGSSAIQAIPIIAAQAAHLTVFQRTATYTVPAWNRPLDPAEVADIKADYPGFRAANKKMSSAFGSRLDANDVGALEVDEDERRRIYQQRYRGGGLPFIGSFNDLLLSKQSNETAADFLRERIQEDVEDADVAARLLPNQVVGCKRLCVDTGYHATFNRPDVDLVDLRATPIEAVTSAGIRTTAGEVELDSIVYATGFDAMTGALLKVDITGRDGMSLGEAWSAGPRTYLGLGVSGFPNLFTITGPGSPSVLTNMIMAIEQHVEWIAGCIGWLAANGFERIEVTPEAQQEWVDYVNTVADFTLFPTCNSWYLGANVPGKTRVFMPLPGFPLYVEQCNDVAANRYRGFAAS